MLPIVFWDWFWYWLLPYWFWYWFWNWFLSGSVWIIRTGNSKWRAFYHVVYFRIKEKLLIQCHNISDIFNFILLSLYLHYAGFNRHASIVLIYLSTTICLHFMLVESALLSVGASHLKRRICFFTSCTTHEFAIFAIYVVLSKLVDISAGQW
jgi:hypothetical protein